MNNCPEWVYVNGSTCATCLAKGRDTEDATRAVSRQLSKDISVPRAEHGMIYYTLMEVAMGGANGNEWTVRYKGDPNQQPGPAAQVTTTSAVPNAAVISRAN
ncbi:hypothetical protein PG997_000742 [Apiospora hydei]|uniref:Uncharacterized protein n=1 Tax=Apiospora hydei TaxID=1337664 RepID=A0ABR1XBR4_9PEZI